MLFRTRSSFGLTLILACSLAACDRAAPDEAQEQGALAGDKASLLGEIDRSQAGALMPAATLTDPAGTQLNLAALQGTPVLLNLWATWCAPCIKEMPMLDDLAGDYDGRLRLITISQDMQGAEVVTPFFEERNFANLEPWLDSDNEVMIALETNVLPTTILYSSSGQEIWRVTGDLNWASASARAAVDEALQET